MNPIVRAIKRNSLRIVTLVVFLFCTILIAYTIRFIVADEIPSVSSEVTHQKALDRELFTKVSEALAQKTAGDNPIDPGLRDPFSPVVVPPSPTPEPEPVPDTETPPADTPVPETPPTE